MDTAALILTKMLKPSLYCTYALFSGNLYTYAFLQGKLHQTKSSSSKAMMPQTETAETYFIPGHKLLVALFHKSVFMPRYLPKKKQWLYGIFLKFQQAIRSQLSTLSFEELQKLKEKVGAKVYKEALFGTREKKNEIKLFKRENKNRPREMSAKKPVPMVTKLPASIKNNEIRDPRLVHLVLSTYTYLLTLVLGIYLHKIYSFQFSLWE